MSAGCTFEFIGPDDLVAGVGWDSGRGKGEEGEEGGGGGSGGEMHFK